MKTFVAIALVLCARCVARAQSYEQRVIAAVIAAEAADQGYRGMAAVGEVIRARSERLGCHPLAVVTRRSRSTGYWAFSCLNGTGPDRLVQRLRTDPGFKDALKVAELVVKRPAALGSSTRGATFFTQRGETPRWARGKRPVVVIGDHAFYRLQFP